MIVGVNHSELQGRIEGFSTAVPAGHEAEARQTFDTLKAGLNDGSIRAAARDAAGVWHAISWVKAGILLGFRLGQLRPAATGTPFSFYEKDTYPLKAIALEDGIRVVPGGSSFRDGCYLGRGVICLPPMYVNVGAYVDEGTMIDSHALVGSCAQIGKRVHLSAGAQIGGVLEPAGALPVIVEDEVLVGGNCGIYEGAIIRERAVLAAGTILTGGSVVFDLVRDTTYRRIGDQPLEIPAGAVVVPGTRPVKGGPGKREGISLSAPVVVKYRDDKTEMSARLEELLR
jgi:2,3,4,5-tetrahydropyridine-2-carboxylate N-succinyltransferase